MKQSIPIIENSASEFLKNRYPNFSPLRTRPIESKVEAVISDVKKNGDNALIEYTKLFDDIELSSNELKVSKEEIKNAYSLVDRDTLDAFELMKVRITEYEKNLIDRNNFTYTIDGTRITCKTIPLESIGCYIPGGKATYPSTVFMTVIPALVAGVKNISVITPPKNDGIDPHILVAADICGVKDIYKIGGAQGIAALAYGSDTIKKVDLIVGPGNNYVTSAKQIVSQDVQIDNPAGPSEILILADEQSNVEFIVLDMLAQAEHGPNGSIILVTTSKELALNVQKRLMSLLSTIKRRAIVTDAILSGGAIIVLKNLEECIDFINSFGPEHLEILMKDSEKISSKINNAGLILNGEYSPVAASDYCIGTNHILPTNGYSSIFSCFSSLNCVKRVNIVNSSREALEKIKNQLICLADVEGLYNHKLSIKGRF